MIIIKLIQYCFWLILLPSVIGKILLPKKEKSLIYSWILGNILQMGIFFLLSVPLVLLKAKFTTLVYLYSSIIILAFIISVLMYVKSLNIKDLSIDIKKFLLNIKNEIKNSIILYKIIFIILLVIQLFVKINYANINNDDSGFVSLSTTMIHTNKMYLHIDNGMEKEEVLSRRALAPISAYYSVLSQLLNTHVTIVTHTVMPIIFIVMAYGVYYYFGKRIFDKEESIYIFLILLCVLNIYAFSAKGYNRYLLLYTWFGRSILAGIILPFVWKISFDAMDKEKNELMDWVTLFILVLAGCLCSQMAVPLLIISIMALALISAIRDKKISYIFKSFMTIVPCLIVGIIYLVIK